VATEHFRARVRAATTAAPAETGDVPGEAPDAAAKAEDVYALYFHGPAFRVLDRVWSTEAGVVGRMARDLPAAFEPADAPLVTRPLLLELCFQTAGVDEIARTGRMGLPSRIERVRLPTCDALEEPLHAVVERRGDAYDARVVDAAGRVALVMEGYVTSALPVDLPAGLRAPLAAGLGIEEG
jgi:hypothetical protein